MNVKIDEVSSTITSIDDFVQQVENHPSKRNEWFDSDLLIVSSIAQKQYAKALTLIDHVNKTGGMCSWGFWEKDFYDLTIDYCQKNQ
jgi:hypothetical protein